MRNAHYVTLPLQNTKVLSYPDNIPVAKFNKSGNFHFIIIHSLAVPAIPSDLTDE